MKLFPTATSLLGFLVILAVLPSFSGAGTLYSTGPLNEIDRCASAWLIKRFVAPDAVFHFYPEGALVTEGIAFDTPEAELRRTHRFSAFETIVNHHNLGGDEKISQLASIIHDIEINVWEKRKNYRKLLHEISIIVETNDTDEKRLKDCLQYFDTLDHSDH